MTEHACVHGRERRGVLSGHGAAEQKKSGRRLPHSEKRKRGRQSHQ